jgi:hypothetical protein
MTAQQKTSRATTVRQRRSAKQNTKPASQRASQIARQSYRPASIFLPVEARLGTPAALRKTKNGALRHAFGVSSPTNEKKNSTRQMTKKSNQKSYDFALSLGRTSVRVPVLSLPKLGPRWVSIVLTLLLALLLYAMETANIFKINTVEVTGNQRLGSADVVAMVGLTGQPIFTIIPSQTEKNLRIAFPDLAGASVRIGFPNQVRITIMERTPILAWYQDGKITWIDPNGVAFTPRGDVPGLIQIASIGNPPEPALDSLKSNFDKTFIATDLVKAILTLFPQVPGGAPMIFDPKYGIGWQDTRGWSVYFGLNSQAIEIKKKVYQAILESFSQKNIQPTLISVAYLDAPFYK